MKVVPLAAESLGVRSMATFVEVGHTSILIDPGASLAPSRYNLPPAAEEWEALRRANARIDAHAARAEIVFISHYHEDHFRADPATYAGRHVLAKDPRRMVEGAQARRAGDLWRQAGPRARLAGADNATLEEAGLALEVSPPLPHGIEGNGMGAVVALTVVDRAERERFVFASDVQGPMSPVVTAYLIRQRPTLLYLSGPPSYIEHEVGAAAIDRAVDNLLRIVEATGCRVILDHHALRDHRWSERLARALDTGRVVTAAGFLGVPDTLLECRRHELWRSARKPAARAGAAGARAMIPRREPPRVAAHFARGGLRP